MTEDLVNHPSHYADGWSNGAEVIDITENLNFNRGNAVKYIARAGKKDPDKLLEDLQKAEFYLKREIQLVTKRWDNPPTYQVVSAPEEPADDFSSMTLQRLLDLASEFLGEQFVGEMKANMKQITDILTDPSPYDNWFTKPAEPEVKQPRVWDSLSDVPIVVEVTDDDGDTWKFDCNPGWQCWEEGEITPSEWVVSSECGPFTEILSDG